jgi:hypothetical protein
MQIRSGAGRRHAAGNMFAGLMLVCAAAGAAILAAPAAAGVILIDGFNDIGAPGTWPVALSAPGTVTVTEGGVSTLGGYRETTIEAQSVAIPGIDSIQVTIAPGPALFDFNSSAGAAGRVTLAYDGGGSMSADFSQQLGIQIDFALFDLANGAPLPVVIQLSDGTNTATLTQSLTSAGAQSLIFSFAQFAGIGSVNLGAIAMVSVDFDAGVGADFRLSQIVTVVPGHGAAALLGIACLAARRRRSA